MSHMLVSVLSTNPFPTVNNNCPFRLVNRDGKGVFHIASRLGQPPPCILDQLAPAFRVPRFDYSRGPFI